MTILTAASRQWATRPNDQRFVNLRDMAAKARTDRENSASKTVSTRQLQIEPIGDDHKSIHIVGQNGTPALLTHYSFGQLASLGGAPAGYLRTLPAEIASDAMNYGLRFARESEDVKVLLTRGTHDDGISEPQDYVSLRAATGPNYGRIWNSDVIDNVLARFGDGSRDSGTNWQVPGEFRRAVPITKANTTLYYGDRDMFIFLADEGHDIEISNRRDGQTGHMARGFFIWNSEVGAGSMGIAMFLYDYTCSNRIVWGVKEFQEQRIRHTASAPDKYIEQILPVVEAYRESSTKGIAETIRTAQQTRLDRDLGEFLKNRFTKPEITAIQSAHMREEGRPIETIWDTTTAITAHAKTIGWQNERVAFERKGGAILDLVASRSPA